MNIYCIGSWIYTATAHEYILHPPMQYISLKKEGYKQIYKNNSLQRKILNECPPIPHVGAGSARPECISRYTCGLIQTDEPIPTSDLVRCGHPETLRTPCASVSPVVNSSNNNKTT